MSFDQQRFALVLRITRIVSSFVFYLFGVTIVLSLLAILGLLLFTPDFLTIDLSNIANLLDRSIAATTLVDVLGDQVLSLQLPLIFIGIATAVLSAVGIWVLRQLRGLLQDVKEERPFSSNNATRLFYITYGLLVVSLVSPLLQSLVIWSVVRQLEGIPHDGFSFSINFGWLFMAALLYILAHIFQYGAHLQDEVDTTV